MIVPHHYQSSVYTNTNTNIVEQWSHYPALQKLNNSQLIKRVVEEGEASIN